MRIDRKADATAADNNKQGDVQAMQFDISGCADVTGNVFSFVIGLAAAP